MREPIWLRTDVVLAFHEAQLREHGGAEGIRDRGMLESALDRPKNKHAYEESDVLACAAAYAYGLAMNHPFFDGNKRTALVACLTFLHLNGFVATATQAETLVAMLQLASGEWGEAEFEAWLRGRVVPR
jgi:death-on-curing protein